MPSRAHGHHLRPATKIADSSMTRFTSPHPLRSKRSRLTWFHSNMYLLHRRFPESTRVCGSAGHMLVLWHAHAVCTTDTTTIRMLLRRVARERDPHGHLLTEGQQPQRIFG